MQHVLIDIIHGKCYSLQRPTIARMSCSLSAAECLFIVFGFVFVVVVVNDTGGSQHAII